MNFWENVVAELEFQGKTRKELAADVGFDASNIGKGEKNGNIPAADTAVKISYALGVSLESLLNIETNKTITHDIPKIDLNLCKKYYTVIQKLDVMPDNTKNLLCKLISEWKRQ